jgi:hypothetical protein
MDRIGIVTLHLYKCILYFPRRWWPGPILVHHYLRDPGGLRAYPAPTLFPQVRDSNTPMINAFSLLPIVYTSCLALANMYFGRKVKQEDICGSESVQHALTSH